MMEKRKPTPIVERIERHKDRFSEKQKRVAEYIVNDYKQAAFLNCRKLARLVSVSPATVCRFAGLLGYDGYPQMQTALQEILQGYLTTEDRLAISMRQRARKRGKGIAPFEQIVLNELESVQTLLSAIKGETFDVAAQMITRAERIFVVGTLGSASLAQYLGYNLGKVHPHVVVLQRGDTEDLLRVRWVNARSLVFLITFPRYPRMTFEMGRLCRRKKAKIIGITNNVLSPVTRYCDLVFYVETRITSFMDPFAAPMCLIHALIAEYTRKNFDRVKDQLKVFEEMATRERFFVRG
jgi:DNA-binding MurR/RpiR family transcriptional regulator